MQSMVEYGYGTRTRECAPEATMLADMVAIDETAGVEAP
jgi:hypothetical protein